MPITVEERYGRRLSSDRAERGYLVLGTPDDAAARAAVLLAAGITFGDLTRDDVEVEELKGIPGGAYLASVGYKEPGKGKPKEGESSFQFETGGGTQHVVACRERIATHTPAGVVAPDFGDLIGVTENGVDGVDITVPVYTFSETHNLDPATVTNTYKGTLFSLTGCTNDAGFKGLAAGECLFLGASGSRRGNDPWEITYAFAGSPNVTGLTIGDINGIDKKGWEYLWLHHTKQEDAAAKMLVYKPLVAVVDRVYDGAGFAVLGIGV